MRFVAKGPSIPDELLEQRDRGNVVFFCGAGVSMPAGLPNFPKLTERVMQVLGTLDSSRTEPGQSASCALWSTSAYQRPREAIRDASRTDIDAVHRAVHFGV